MIGFNIWELGLIFLLALILIGPKHLPALAQRLGFWLGKARKIKDSIKIEAESLLNDETSEKDKDQQQKK